MSPILFYMHPDRSFAAFALVLATMLPCTEISTIIVYPQWIGKMGGETQPLD